MIQQVIFVPRLYACKPVSHEAVQVLLRHHDIEGCSFCADSLGSALLYCIGQKWQHIKAHLAYAHLSRFNQLWQHHVRFGQGRQLFLLGRIALSDLQVDL